MTANGIIMETTDDVLHILIYKINETITCSLSSNTIKEWSVKDGKNYILQNAREL